jgi:hypothetical protein
VSRFETPPTNAPCDFRQPHLQILTKSLINALPVLTINQSSQELFLKVCKMSSTDAKILKTEPLVRLHPSPQPSILALSFNGPRTVELIVCFRADWRECKVDKTHPVRSSARYPLLPRSRSARLTSRPQNNLPRPPRQRANMGACRATNPTQRL